MSQTIISRGLISYSQKAASPINFPPLPDKQYGIIYADPPWHYGGKLQHEGKKGDYAGGCNDYYQSVPTEEMAKLSVPDIMSGDCLLFMWTTNPHLPQAIALGMAWGFQYSTVAFVWDKKIHNPGRYTLSQCELVLLFKSGKIPSPRGRRNIRQLYSQKRGRHSEKPAEIRDAIVEMFPSQPRIELFAREKFDGWDVWGNDIG